MEMKMKVGTMSFDGVLKDWGVVEGGRWEELFEVIVGGLLLSFRLFQPG
jgi:hypothetical protein